MVSFSEVMAEYFSEFQAMIHKERKKSFWRKLRRLKVLFRSVKKCGRVNLRRRSI